MVRPHPELRQDAGSELHLNSSSYQQACLFLTFREKADILELEISVTTTADYTGRGIIR